jgi:hypothetical protein
MNHVYRYRHVVRVLAAFACTLLGLAASAPAAFAVRVGANGSGESPPPLPTGKYPTHAQTHTIVTGGMPGWQLAVILAVATLVVATIAVVVYRMRGLTRNRVVPAT